MSDGATKRDPGQVERAMEKALNDARQRGVGK